MLMHIPSELAISPSSGHQNSSVTTLDGACVAKKSFELLRAFPTLATFPAKRKLRQKFHFRVFLGPPVD